jgi:uncharacterized protein YbaP (TraB family)
MMSLKRLFAPFAAIVAFLAPAADARAPEPVRPALWAVSDADTTIYLFGTIHLLPDEFQWRTPRFDRAVAGSQQLVVETLIDQKNPTRLMSALSALGYAKGLPPLDQRVAPKLRPALATAVKKSGIPAQFFDQMKTWTAAFMLMGTQYKEMGLKGTAGVETVLRANFEGAGKPIGELETNVEQLGVFNTLPEEAQRLLLEGAIETPADSSKEFNSMLKAWSRGDVSAISRSFDQQLSASPALKDALMKRRNNNWSRWIEQRMAQPGAVMIAVGAGHLAGPDSVISNLKKDGYRVERLQ